ncbi:MAG: helix-turn-helix domain-containing protein [Candidatus Aminicenantes bacterium]|nr:helix-turn-helix domain-containing protein [Candidatus Aminicenantes bacterium]NIM80715.1 helix-turn-helix domain-containing protein [Candidatus Aminicenantes bacterium]NIN20090.1 helix-turn-helix domain-containing protein [Candidatus Aminicenantes bacterium]NIN43877.1 helix-turn-helix domain-containing protein [Candidatus Aminicenantes bacterium]NIN86686.1 helix-turn-helix domain-containing protein [Candidatus Aminicenantes bacterium]
MRTYKGKIKTLDGIGKRLRLLRKQLNYSAQEMAARLGLNYNSYYKNENSETYPGINTLYQLSEAHDISIDWLMFGKGPMYCQEKGREKELAELGKELELMREKLREQEEKAGIRFRPELQELLEHMERIPLLYHEVLVYFQRFKVENSELVEASMSREQS